MELFFTDRATITEQPAGDNAGCPLKCPASAVSALIAEVIPDGMPFVLEGNGHYHRVINWFLRDLPADGCPSANTWRAYARDIVTFARFLAEKRGGKDILDTVADDIHVYYRTRILGDTDAISRVSWNRAITALDKFFNWALDHGLVRSTPFTYRHAMARMPGMATARFVRRNNALTKVNSGDAIKCISLEEFLVFRNVGLLGQLPDGSSDPGFRGRNRLRNAAFAEVLVTTGIRLEEGGTLLRAEMPNSDTPTEPTSRSYKMELAPPTTKRNRGRPIWVAKRVLQELVWPYIQEERDNAAIKAASTGRYLLVQHPLAITTWRSMDCTGIGYDGKPERIFYRKLSPADRRRMLTLSPLGFTEPGLLWLTENGMPPALNMFEAVFARACERLKQFGFDVWITPHTLRHTFAVYMLSQLIRDTVGTVIGISGKRQRMGDNIYRRIIADPLRTVQKLLGHASITSTYKYLTYIEEAEEFVAQAIGSWGDRLGGPADHFIDASA